MSDNDYKLNETQRRHLAAVLDQIIPPDSARGMPGGGDAGLVDFVEDVLRSNPAHRLGLEPGLASFGELLEKTGSAETAYEEVQAEQPGFIPTLVFHAYAGYYQNPTVLEAIGMEPRPPHPKGYEMEPFDPTLLEKVRERGKIYRDV